MASELIIEAVPAKKIIALGEDIGEYSIDDLKKLNFDVLVYNYQDGGYDGSGVAVWKKGDKYFYHELSHCSCNGPTENIAQSANVAHTLDEVTELLKKNYNWDGYGQGVVEEIKKY